MNLHKIVEKITWYSFIGLSLTRRNIIIKIVHTEKSYCVTKTLVSTLILMNQRHLKEIIFKCDKYGT